MDDIKAKLNKLWNGDVPLVFTFWLWYVLGVFVLRLLAEQLGAGLGILIVGWAGFMVLPIWRSADKYTGNSLFALLAKIAAVFIALGALGTLLS
jgi:FtsH-binding integral membrane protein